MQTETQVLVVPHNSPLALCKSTATTSAPPPRVSLLL